MLRVPIRFLLYKEGFKPTIHTVDFVSFWTFRKSALPRMQNFIQVYTGTRAVVKHINHVGANTTTKTCEDHKYLLVLNRRLGNILSMDYVGIMLHDSTQEPITACAHRFPAYIQESLQQ